MKTCVSSYSFGGYAADNKLGYLGIIDWAAEHGFDGIEYTDGNWMNIENAPEKIRERCAEKGIVPVSLCVGADFINGSGGDLKAEIARLQHQVDFAARMGVKVMRHDATNGISGRQYAIGYDDALPIIAEGAREVTKYAEQKGVITATENHGQFSQDANRVEKFINTVNHPNFGALVDLGNFMCADEDPTLSVGIMARYAKHVHAKDFFFKSGMLPNPGNGWFGTRAGNYLRGTIVGHGDAKIAQSIRILKNNRYDGFVSIEFEGCEDNLLGISWGLENLKKYIG